MFNLFGKRDPSYNTQALLVSLQKDINSLSGHMVRLHEDLDSMHDKLYRANDSVISRLNDHDRRISKNSDDLDELDNRRQKLAWALISAIIVALTPQLLYIFDVGNIRPEKETETIKIPIN